MPFLFLERAEKIERESSKKEGEGRESKVRNETCASQKEEKAVSGFSYIEASWKPCHGDPRRFEGEGVEVVTILTYFRMTGLGLVPRQLQIFQIVTRASLKENKNSFAALFLELHRNLCADQIVISLL